MYTSIWWYLRILPVPHRQEVVDIGAKSYIEKHTICLKDYRLQSFLSIKYVHGDLCKHLGIDSCLHKSPCECQILKNDLII